MQNKRQKFLYSVAIVDNGEYKQSLKHELLSFVQCSCKVQMSKVCTETAIVVYNGKTEFLPIF